MKKITSILLIFFWIVLTADCILIMLHYNSWRLITKTLLIPLLLLAVYFEAGDTVHKRSRMLVIPAFFFCFAGDCLLLFDTEPGNFTMGLIAFLLAHILFIIFFYRLRPFSSRNSTYIFAWGLLILLYVLLLLFLLWNNVAKASFEIPVTIYAIVLGFMLLTAINTYKNKSLRHLSKSFFIPGAVFFVCSDSMLAWNKFNSSFLYADILVMITYGIAVYLLAYGAIRFLR